ncbi:MAG: site-specific integrase [Treponema sp.]|jgi:integrase|nr:site-specific integrase [Treponema sp.]
MHPRKPRKPFTLYKKETQAGPVWYARYWDEDTRRYAVTRTTGVIAEGKKQRRYEAEEAAREMMPRIKFIPPPPEKSFVQYLEDFWTPGSPYIQEAALVKKRPLSVAYVKMNHDDVKLHIASFPPFKKIKLQELTPAMIRDWLIWMAGKGLSGHRINKVLLAMRVATRYAVSREEMDRDPFKGIGKAAEFSKEKGILMPDEIHRLITAPVTDPRVRLAVLLAVLCGMRRGEIRGLQWGDIADGLIHIRHNWINGEGIKAPKCKGGAVRENSRTVPLPGQVLKVLETIKPNGRNPEAFIFEGNKGPLSNNFFRYGFRTELEKIGIPGQWTGKEKAPEGYINEQRRRNLTFHGLRHTFITISRLAGITDLEIQTLAGHKSNVMMENYSHAAQVLDFSSAKEKLERAITKAEKKA